MPAHLLPIITLLLGGVFVGALLTVNVTLIPFSIFGAITYVPQGLVLVFGYVLGVALTLPVFLDRIRASQKSVKALSKWEGEDQKLLQQVQSDKEKQLEAKIATLESALQRALKK